MCSGYPSTVLRVGLEPTTPRSSGECSSQLSYLSISTSIPVYRYTQHTTQAHSNTVSYNYMSKTTKTTLALGLAITILIILINSYIQNPTAWYIVDALFVLIPIIFTATGLHTKHGALVAIILWIPAIIVGYMAVIGFLGIPHPIWTALNMWQLVVYSYLIGTRFKIRI